MIGIIDYNVGNVKSISNMLHRIGVDSVITSKAEDIGKCDKIIIPGVGAFDYGMRSFNDLGLKAILTEQVVSKGKPVLGICLGAQLLCNGSEEGSIPGLGWIDANVKRFENLPNNLKVPHMGWRDITIEQEHVLTNGLSHDSRYYFVHSYYIQCKDPSNVLITAEHGHVFDAGICKNKIYGVQFHPEKSHKFGLALLKNFVDIGDA